MPTVTPITRVEAAEAWLGRSVETALDIWKVRPRERLILVDPLRLPDKQGRPKEARDKLILTGAGAVYAKIHDTPRDELWDLDPGYSATSVPARFLDCQPGSIEMITYYARLPRLGGQLMRHGRGRGCEAMVLDREEGGIGVRTEVHPGEVHLLAPAEEDGDIRVLTLARAIGTTASLLDHAAHEHVMVSRGSYSANYAEAA